ncbi:MAG: hypothetical protein K6U80_01330 [Firmicutes bacterium]|nr:hypothetical protein [Bacillota bacterium]
MDKWQNFLAINKCFEKIIAKTFGLSRIRIKIIKQINTYQEFVKCYLDYQRNILPVNNHHIEIFSRIYYWYIKVISQELNTAACGISIHDAGTCAGILPLMLCGLNEAELMGVKISKVIASDLKYWRAWFIINSVIKRNKGLFKPLRIIKLDCTKQLEKAPETDVVILTDVLEHFGNEDIAKSIVKGFWAKTKKLLLIHVPLEPVPNIAVGHYLTFNADKIRDWASELKDGAFLSDKYYELDNQSLTHYGYLIVSRISRI